MGDSMHDTVSYAVYMTMEHGPTFGGLTPRKTNLRYVR